MLTSFDFNLEKQLKQVFFRKKEREAARRGEKKPTIEISGKRNL